MNPVAGAASLTAAIAPAATDPGLLALLVGGILAGLVLLGRGFGGYRAAGRIGGTAASRIGSIALGEVLVTGVAEPIELTLVSPLQSAPCVYYRARVAETRDTEQDVFHEERAVGFRVRDPSGTVRVFPAHARFDVPERFDERAGQWGGDPPGLLPRTGSPFGPGEDRDAQIAALLTVHDPGTTGGGANFAATARLHAGGLSLGGASGRRYSEARIDAGDVVTVLGTVVPFSDIADPTAANLLEGSGAGVDDAEIAADLAAARSSGSLVGTATEAWGNAAIEGFGIGRPVRAPVLDAGATPPPPPDAALAQRAHDAFEIAPGTLVLAASDEMPLRVSLGAPSAIAAREQGRFVLGLLGAVVSIASAMTLAVVLGGGLR
jgi:hypothetical protein